MVWSVLSDTTSRMAAIQLRLYREAGPSRRAQIAVDLSEAVRATTLAGIRRRHPEYSEEEVRTAFLRIVYGFRR
jgi:C4-dicarboxylate-specific signal transduction histidine kinase